MPRTTLCWLTLLTLSLAATTAAASDESGKRVDARQLMGASSDDPLTIEVSAPDVLVFDASGGDYVLDGRALDLRADLVEVRGNVVLRSHPTDAPSDTAGRSGLDAAPIQLTIGQLEAIDGATWRIVNDGTDGSKGRLGEQGSAGANGAPGSPRRCGRHAKEPTAGGPGGSGGRGGNGGPGGSGGSAADIVLSPNLCSGDAAKSLEFSTQGGRGGAGGEAGAGGPGGLGGKGGFAAWCGPAGQDGPAGSAGQPGDNGPRGDDGNSGRILTSDGRSCST